MNSNEETLPRKRLLSGWEGVLLGMALLACGLIPLFASTSPELPPLTTVSGSPRLPGKFVWADLVTDDVPTARNFYAQLFGWRFWDMGNYAIAANQERPLCGMFQRPRPKDKPEAKPRWFGYISVANVARAAREVTKAGGKVLAEPKKFPKRGEQAIFSDAEGAIFGVIKSSSGDPEDFQPEPGDWIWIQLMSRDGRKASEFYRNVGGYDIIENTSSNRLSDYVLASEGYARATVRSLSKENAQVQPTWLPFVRVKNVADSVAQASRLGGKILAAPKPEFLEGKVAVIADPTGAAVGLLEWSDNLLKGGR
jgi:predicted enzyme related to lactoylglutathione lyase